MTFGEFLSLSTDSDMAFLSLEELKRFVPTCCAMANGEGGWVVFGVTMKESGLPAVEGVPDAASLEKQLAAFLQTSRTGGANLISHLHTLSDAGKKILVARVEPVEWRLRPVCVGKNGLAYRRIEGENVISSRKIRWRMALDALDVQRDGTSVPGLTMSDIDSESLASFRDKLIARFPKWKTLSMENFLKRALVLNERGEVTRAGELLFGKNSDLVRLSIQDTQKIHNIPNLWSACEVLLPRISGVLTSTCAEALRECFVNSMLHADHDAGVIEIELRDGTAVFSNPGLPRSLVQGESRERNHRLMRIFVMAGLARGAGQGLDIVREYDADFRLRWDMLNLATIAELPLSTKAEFHEPEKPTFFSPGWLPIVPESYSMDKVSDAGEIDEDKYIDTADDDEEEYLGTADDDENDVFSPLVRMVRDTPRMSPDIVRDAILELCSEYRSLSELALALARSENSLRRHYITSMIKEGLLEMEYPDRVGHPDQRYKGKLQST